MSQCFGWHVKTPSNGRPLLPFVGELHVLTKHTLAIFSPAAAKQRRLFQESNICLTDVQVHLDYGQFCLNTFVRSVKCILERGTKDSHDIRSQARTIQL